MTIRIGLLGCGEHSEIGHAVPLSRYARTHSDAITLAAACDLRRERAELFREKYGFRKAYVEMNEMLANETLDVCIAVVPVNLISNIGVALLEAKIPCVVEKPLGASLNEVRQLLQTARDTGTPNMVSVNRRFMPLLTRGIKWAHEAGPLRYVSASMLRHARTESDFLQTTAIHAIDTVRFIGGDFAALNIRALNQTSPHWYGIDIEFENGIFGRIDVLPTAGMVEETYELIGDDFRCIVTSPFGPQRLLRCYRKNELVLEEVADKSTPEVVIFGFYAEAAELIAALSHGRPARPSIEEVFPSVEAGFELAEQIAAGSEKSRTSPNK